MTRRRWIADEVSRNRAALIGEHARHLSQVLRARVGQEFEFALGEVVMHSAPLPITVAISIFKFDRMEWAIEKCTELGVARMIPVITARTETHLAAAAAKRAERWKRIAKQASEQSRRVAPPEIVGPIKFKEMLAVAADVRVVLSEAESDLMLKEAIPQKASSLLLAFGPEGGWKEEELSEFRDAEWASASLGNTILRAETAVIAGVAIASSFFNR